MSGDYRDGTVDPFGRKPTVAEVDAAIYGGEPVDLPMADVPVSGRMIAEPVDIMQIWPDMKQPRRAIPPAVRGTWDGNPATIGGIFEKWHSMASESGRVFDMIVLLLGGNDGTAYERSGDPIYDGWVELAALAANIQRAGLLNPITVYQQDDRYVIETGERRWLAHHLLVHYLDTVWHKRIPARVQEQFSVWRQASENGARASLNAIGRARQLALLLMNMHDDVYFDTYETLVLPGECDRIFYAQVADGQAFRVKRGMSQAVLDAMGLKSIRQISQYRALLDIGDKLWEGADAHNWTEFAIRSIVVTPPMPEMTPHTGTTVPLSDENKLDDNEIGGQDQVDRPLSELSEAAGQGEIESPSLMILQLCYGHLAECAAFKNGRAFVSLNKLCELSSAQIQQLMDDPEVDFAAYLHDLDLDFTAVMEWIWNMHQAYMSNLNEGANDG